MLCVPQPIIIYVPGIEFLPIFSYVLILSHSQTAAEKPPVDWFPTAAVTDRRKLGGHWLCSQSSGAQEDKIKVSGPHSLPGP